MMVKRHTFGLKYESNRLLVLLFTITACVALAFYVGFIMGEEIVYTHFFYIPIILAGVWYHKKAVYAALFLSIVHILVTHLSPHVVTIDNFARCTILVAVAYVIGLVSEKRAKGEEELRETRDYLDNLIHYANAPIIVWDPEKRITRFNHAFEHMTGYTADEVIGQELSILFPEASRDESLSKIERALSGEYWESVEIPILRKDGDIRIALWNSANIYAEDGKTLLAAIAQGTDITERKRAEDALAASKAYTELIIQNFLDTLIVVDAEAKIKTVNPATCHLLGYTEEKLIGQPISVIFAAEEEEEEELVVIEDITERRQMEEALIRSERFKALGAMAAGVAHDFNNLLAIILGNAQLLEKGMEKYKAEEIKERLKIIARTAYEGGATVKRLQHFTGTEVSTHDFTKLDLNEIVREAIASTSPRWKDEAEAKGTTIRIKEKLGELPSILGSRSELMEVLTNLIFNALEAMPKGGEITVRTEAKEKEVLLYFTDTGKGISKRIRNNIFDPFFTTKGSRSSGLGLSVSYGIIKHHQGKIKVESIKGKGTTFTISIPIYLEAPLKKEKVKDAEKISPKKILVVDDEEGIREVLKTILQDEGHRVVLAKTAQEGLDKFKQDNFDWALTGLEDNFDLVLTDLGMSGMSGWQLAKKIKGMDSDVPVGLITGWAVAITKEKMKEERVDFILSKPFDYTKVVKKVNAVLRSKRR